MPKIFTSEKQKLGELGENIACKFLMKHNFSIIERNYTKKWGEIDIVAEKNDKLYFIEVKSVSTTSLILPLDKGEMPKAEGVVSREIFDSYRPEDNMHPWKLKRLARTIQTYLLSKKISDDIEWQVDLACVFLDMKNKKARVKIFSNLIL